MSERITLKEFRAWLDGLLSGRDVEREALPTRDQWQKILAKIDSIEGGVGSVRAADNRPAQADLYDELVKRAEIEKARRFYLPQQWLGSPLGQCGSDGSPGPLVTSGYNNQINT